MGRWRSNAKLEIATFRNVRWSLVVSRLLGLRFSGDANMQFCATELTRGSFALCKHLQLEIRLKRVELFDRSCGSLVRTRDSFFRNAGQFMKLFLVTLHGRGCKGLYNLQGEQFLENTCVIPKTRRANRVRENLWFTQVLGIYDLSSVTRDIRFLRNSFEHRSMYIYRNSTYIRI